MNRMFFRCKKEKQARKEFEERLAKIKASKPEHDKDLENLKNLQEQGKIGKDEDLEEFAQQVSHWRHSPYYGDKVEFAYFARDEELDQLVNSESVGIRIAVASRGRAQDLDKLVSDPYPMVRQEVARQGRPQDLDMLLHDLDPDVRRVAAEKGSQKQLEKMIKDPDLDVRYILAYRGNQLPQNKF